MLFDLEKIKNKKEKKKRIERTKESKKRPSNTLISMLHTKSLSWFFFSFPCSPFRSLPLLLRFTSSHTFSLFLTLPRSHSLSHPPSLSLSLSLSAEPSLSSCSRDPTDPRPPKRQKGEDRWWWQRDRRWRGGWRWRNDRRLRERDRNGRRLRDSMSSNVRETTSERERDWTKRGGGERPAR